MGCIRGSHDPSEYSYKMYGTNHKVARFGIFLKSTSGLVPDGRVGLIKSSCRYHFRTFQLELDILDTKNIGNGSVVTKLQPLEVGQISENPGKSWPGSPFLSIRASSRSDSCFPRFGPLKKRFNIVWIESFSCN